MAKAGPLEKKKKKEKRKKNNISELPRDLTGAPANTTRNVFLVLPAPPLSLSLSLALPHSHMPSWLFFFHPLVRHERHPYFFTILTRWFKSDTDTFIVFALACVNVFPSDWRPGRGPDRAAVRAVRLSAPLSQLTHVTGVSSTDTPADMLSPLYEVLLRMFG